MDIASCNVDIANCNVENNQHCTLQCGHCKLQCRKKSTLQTAMWTLQTANCTFSCRVKIYSATFRVNSLHDPIVNLTRPSKLLGEYFYINLILWCQDLEDLGFVRRCIVLSDIANHLVEAINRGDLLCTSN